MTNRAKNLITKLAAMADVEIGGDRDWDVQVHNEQLYSNVLKEGSLALGEGYMAGWWDCNSIDELVCRVVKANLMTRVSKNYKLLARFLLAKLINFQSKNRAAIVGEKHYDLGNDLYQAMLDQRMVYTCGYWKEAKTLDEAQEAKLKLTCDKLGLKPGMKVLDIGCGWGSFAKFAAENYGVEVVGITISKEQVKLGMERCQGLPVELRFQDYREVNESFDRIVSLGMFEHVGKKNYRRYMKVANRCLTDDGLFLLHTIGSNESSLNQDPWIEKYIFPNAVLPSVKMIAEAYEGLFVMEDWHNFGADYDKTLMAWYENFKSHWDQLKTHYDERFYRMWEFYLLSCAGLFRARHTQLWQIVLSKDGVPGGYNSVR